MRHWRESHRAPEEEYGSTGLARRGSAMGAAEEGAPERVGVGEEESHRLKVSPR